MRKILLLLAAFVFAPVFAFTQSPNVDGLSNGPNIDYAGPRYFYEQAADPTQQSDRVICYGKDNGAGVTDFYCILSDGTVTNVTSGGEITLDEIGDPAADHSFTMANKTLTWNFVNPAGGMVLNWTGNASGHQFELNQNTGNMAAGTHMLHIEAEDSDVLEFHVTHDGNHAAHRLMQFELDRSGTSDNDEIYASWIFDHDGSVTSQGAEEFVRETSVATDVTEDSEDAEFQIDVMSDGALTKIFTVDNAGINVVGDVGSTSISPTYQTDGLSQGDDVNCQLDYTASTLSVLGDDGNALSATNQCCIGVQSATAGQSETICFSSPVSSTFGATSDTDGNTFGTTASTAWSSSLPMYGYTCIGSASNYLAFSRKDNKYETGNAAGDMCQEGDTDCDAENDLFIMTTGLTLASEVDRPCTLAFSFTATKDASDQWTVDALSYEVGFGSDAISKTQNKEYSCVRGQNGAQSGTFFQPTAGNEPVGTEVCKYTAKNGYVSLTYTGFSYNAGTAGTGANPCNVTLPLAVLTDSGVLRHTSGSWFVDGGTNRVCVSYASDGSTSISTYCDDNAVINCEDLAASNDQYFVSIRYPY